jgi:hypothetical protein
MLQPRRMARERCVRQPRCFPTTVVLAEQLQVSLYSIPPLQATLMPGSPAL